MYTDCTQSVLYVQNRMLSPEATSLSTSSKIEDSPSSSGSESYDLTCRRPSQRMLLRARSDVYREQQKGGF